MSKKLTKYPGDPGKDFTWRGIKFTRNTDRFTRNTDRRNQCPLDFTSEGYWIHPYEIREPGLYGGLTGKFKWVAHTPLLVPSPSGCLGSPEGHGTSPIKALEDALKVAEEQAHKVSRQLRQLKIDIKKLKGAEFRPSLRRWDVEALLLRVRAMVEPLAPGTRITAEEIATELRATKPMVEQCFHKLNLEGTLTQGINRAPHDSTRDEWGTDSSWCATQYERISLTKPQE